MKGYRFAQEVYERVGFSAKSGISKGKGLGFGAKPPREKIY